MGDFKDLDELTTAYAAKFDEFKSVNDKKISAIEFEKKALADKVEKLSESLSLFEKQKAALEKEILDAKRPSASGNLSKEAQEHKAAYYAYLRKGTEDGLRELEIKVLRTTVGADGGFAVPEEQDRNIITLQRNMSPMRQVCDQVTVGSNDFKRLVNTGLAAAGWVGEEDARPQTGTPQLANLPAFMGELYANPAATQTALDDLFYDVEGDLSKQIATAFDEMEGSGFLLGNGTNKPKGILSYNQDTAADATRAFGTLQKIKSGTAGGLDGDDLLNVIYALKAGYRQNAQWMMSALMLLKIRTLKDSQNNYLWKPGLEAGQPSSLAGYSVAENEDMPEPAAGSASILFGDFKRAYTIVDRFGVRMLRDPYTAKPNVLFYTTKRVGGMLVDSRAVKVMTLEV